MKTIQVHITEDQAARLIIGAGFRVEEGYDISYIKEVNPITIKPNVYITYLNSEQSADKSAGFHICFNF